MTKIEELKRMLKEEHEYNRENRQCILSIEAELRHKDDQIETLRDEVFRFMRGESVNLD